MTCPELDKIFFTDIKIILIADDVEFLFQGFTWHKTCH